MTDTTTTLTPERRAFTGVTASRISDMMARTTSGWGAGRANYAADLIALRLGGQLEEGFQSAEMKRGIEVEPQARAAYEWQNDCVIEPAGFVIHPKIKLGGASPDGLVGKDGLTEIKCPMTAGHLETLLGKSVPQKYIYQIQWQLACTGRKWCDFCSYDNRLPEPMQLFVLRVPRDPVMIRELEEHVVIFLKEIDEKIREIKARFRVQEVA